MWPRPSAAMTPSIMDSTSAAVSACSRRSSSKRSPSWRCIWRSAWTSASISGTPERGKRGGEPAAMARAAAVMSVSGRAIERPAISANSAPTARARSAAPATARCARRTMSSTWLRLGRDPDRARAAGHRDVEQGSADRLAAPGGRPDPARQGGVDLGTVPRDSRAAGAGPAGNRCRPAPGRSESTSVIRWPFSRRKAVHASRPTPTSRPAAPRG